MKAFFKRFRRDIRELWDTIRVRVLTMGSLIVFLGICFYIFGRLVYSESHEQLGRTLESFAQKFSQTLEMLNLDLRHLDSAEHVKLRTLFRDPMFGDTGYPFVIQMTGQIDFHFFRDGDRISREVMDQMASSPSRRGRLRLRFEDQENQEREIIFTYVRDLDCFLAIEVSDIVFDATLNGLRIYSWVLFILGSFLVWFILTFYTRREKSFLQRVHHELAELAEGTLPPLLHEHGQQRSREIAKELNRLIRGLETTTTFVQHLSSKNLTSDFQPMSPRDELGNCLLELRANLQKQQQEEEHIKEEERIRSWSNEGLAEFAKLLRENSSNIEQLADILLQRIVNYLGATQGGLFLAEEHKTGTVLHLTSAFAYDRKKYMEQDIALGEGLVGTCAIEREIIHIDIIPDDYCSIVSGIGYTPPKELLLVPLKTDDALLGVLELASLNGFAPYMVSFAQLLSVSIAQTLQQTQTNQRTAELLRQSQEQREAMQAQEEEMRQNMEEMQATQEEMTRRTQEFEVLDNVINSTVLYAEFTAEGLYTRGNRHFVDSLHRIRASEYDHVRLEDILSLYTLDGSENERLPDLLEEVLTGIPQTRLLLWKDDSQRFLYASFTSLANDGASYIYMVAQDITHILAVLGYKK